MDGYRALSKYFPLQCENTDSNRQKIRTLFERIINLSPTIDYILKVSLYDNLHIAAGIHYYILNSQSHSLKNLINRPVDAMILAVLPIVASIALHELRLLSILVCQRISLNLLPEGFGNVLLGPAMQFIKPSDFKL